MNKYFTDSIFRIGGDAFVILYTGKDQSEFDQTVALIKDQFSRTEDLSISIGSVWCTDTRSIQKQISLADELMYIDKQNYYKTHWTNNPSGARSYRAEFASQQNIPIVK